MAKGNPTDRAQRDPISPNPKDKKAERTVLAFLLYKHPERLTIPKLSRVLNKGGDEFDRDDAVERAVRELVGVGLLEMDGLHVAPTSAALYFDALESD